MRARKTKEKSAEPNRGIVKKRIHDLADYERKKAIQEANTKKANIGGPGANRYTLETQINSDLQRQLEEINAWEQQEINKLSQTNEQNE